MENLIKTNFVINREGGGKDVSEQYVTLMFMETLRSLNAQIEEQGEIQKKFPLLSKEYQKSLQDEIELLKRKRKLLQDEKV